MSQTVNFQIHIATGKIWNDDEDMWDTIPPDYGDEILQGEPTLKFTVTYPLTNPYAVEFVHEDGSPWTRRQFIDAVIASYKVVYSSEPDPGHITGMLNRQRSEGPFGIWGHDIGDLVLEGAAKNGEEWELHIGS
jgi:hypothetical protein